MLVLKTLSCIVVNAQLWRLRNSADAWLIAAKSGITRIFTFSLNLSPPRHYFTFEPPRHSPFFSNGGRAWWCECPSSSFFVKPKILSLEPKNESKHFLSLWFMTWNIDKTHEKGGGQRVFFENWTKHVLIWSCCQYSLSIQCPELKTRETKGWTLLPTKTSHFAHLGILFFYDVKHGQNILSRSCLL